MRSTGRPDLEPRFEDRVVFSTDLVRIGAFRCDRDHVSFRESAPIENYCFWFPRTPVVIEPEHEPAFVVNPNIATFYNKSQTYGRHAVGDHGDNSDWFGVDRELLCDALRDRLPGVGGEPAHLFPFSHCAVDARTYLLQRQIFEAVKAGPRLDAFEVEEIVVLLLDRMIEHAVEPVADRRSAILRQHRNLAIEAEILLSDRFDEALSLDSIAKQVGASVFHLCRTFRRVTGATLHQYRTSLRLRASLERISESAETLTDVAVGLGFANHSHFTCAFRHEFRQLPSAYRTACGTALRLPPRTRPRPRHHEKRPHLAEETE